MTGHGETVGAALVGHPRVRMSSLTGDVSTGKKVREAATANLRRDCLEIGGKAPAIVYDDDFERMAAKISAGADGNSMQDRMAATRVYAESAIYSEFVRRPIKAVEAVMVGEPGDTGAEMGLVISETQRHRIKGFVDWAIVGNARLHTGGKRDGPDQPASAGHLGDAPWWVQAVRPGRRHVDPLARRVHRDRARNGRPRGGVSRGSPS